MVFVKNGLTWSRLAIITGRKLGKAHLRNYEKRICREFFREIKDSIPSGYDFLVIVKRRSKSFAESREDFMKLFKKAMFLIARDEG